LTFVRVDRADTLKVATDKVVIVPSVEIILDVPSVFRTVAADIVATPEVFSVTVVSVPDTERVVAERVFTSPFEEKR